MELDPGKIIKTEKRLTLGEEYLADHFPTFPVMPGVLMLQALVESGAWLWRFTDDFRNSVIIVREAKNVKYGTFMEPGRTMAITCEFIQKEGDLAVFKGKGESEGGATVSARFSLSGYNLGDRDASFRPTDERLIQHWRAVGSILTRGVKLMRVDAHP